MEILKKSRKEFVDVCERCETTLKFTTEDITDGKVVCPVCSCSVAVSWTAFKPEVEPVDTKVMFTINGLPVVKFDFIDMEGKGIEIADGWDEFEPEEITHDSPWLFYVTKKECPKHIMNRHKGFLDEFLEHIIAKDPSGVHFVSANDLFRQYAETCKAAKFDKCLAMDFFIKYCVEEVGLDYDAYLGGFYGIRLREIWVDSIGGLHHKRASYIRKRSWAMPTHKRSGHERHCPNGQVVWVRSTVINP